MAKLFIFRTFELFVQCLSGILTIRQLFFSLNYYVFLQHTPALRMGKSRCFIRSDTQKNKALTWKAVICARISCMPMCPCMPLPLYALVRPFSSAAPLLVQVKNGSIRDSTFPNSWECFSLHEVITLIKSS